METVAFKQDYRSYLSQEEQRAEQLQQEATKSGDMEKAAEAAVLIHTVGEVREGFQKAGVSLDEIKVMTGGSNGSQQAMGAYERKPNQIGRTGLTSIEKLVEASKDGEEIAEITEQTLRHEFHGHRESHKNSIARGTDGQVQQMFGEEVARALDEEAAMRAEKVGDPLKGKTSEYKDFRKEARDIAGDLRTNVVRLFAEGRENEIVEKALERGQERGGFRMAA